MSAFTSAEISVWIPEVTASADSLICAAGFRVGDRESGLAPLTEGGPEMARLGGQGRATLAGRLMWRTLGVFRVEIKRRMRRPWCAKFAFLAVSLSDAGASERRVKAPLACWCKRLKMGARNHVGLMVQVTSTVSSLIPKHAPEVSA